MKCNFFSSLFILENKRFHIGKHKCGYRYVCERLISVGLWLRVIRKQTTWDRMESECAGFLMLHQARWLDHSWYILTCGVMVYKAFFFSSIFMADIATTHHLISPQNKTQHQGLPFHKDKEAERGREREAIVSGVCSCCEAGRLLERRLVGTVPWAQLRGGCQAAQDSGASERARRATWALSVTVGRCLHKGPEGT